MFTRAKRKRGSDNFTARKVGKGKDRLERSGRSNSAMKRNRRIVSCMLSHVNAFTPRTSYVYTNTKGEVRSRMEERGTDTSSLWCSH